MYGEKNMLKICPPEGSPDCPGVCDECRRNPDIQRDKEDDRAEYMMEKAEADRLYN